MLLGWISMRANTHWMRTVSLGLVLLSSTLQSQIGVAAAAIESEGAGFYALYAENRREGIANLITEDLLLQAYSMYRARRLVALEREQLLPALERTVAGLHALLSRDPDRYSERSKAYVALLQALLAGRTHVAQSPQVQAELALIIGAKSVQLSPLWGYSIDYTRLSARGQYLDDPDLQRYFVASRYASSVLFAVVPSAATGVSDSDATAFAEQALELSHLLAEPSVAPAYEQLTALLDWQFGAADDLLASDVRRASTGAELGLSLALRKIAVAEDKVPKILGQAVAVDKLETGLSAQQALIGWRLLPSRWSADAQALQSLVFSNADTLRWPCQDCAQPAMASAAFGGWHKSYPSYKELMAGIGSMQAKAWVQEQALHRYSGYSERAQQIAPTYDAATGLAAQQLRVLRAALTSDEPMQSLQSGAGFWVWQRYLARLYQKQSSTPFSKGLQLTNSVRPGAFIAPNTPLYEALARLADTHAQRENHAGWTELSQMFQRCAEISQRAEKSQALNAEDERFLNGLDLTLKRLTGRDDLPIVTELHRNYQDRKVLQIALALPLVVQVESARGARFQVQEFLQPFEQTLDNLAWRQGLLKKGKE